MGRRARHDDIAAAMEKIIEAQPDAVTMLKGTAEKVFRPYAGAVPWIMKATTFSPYQPAYDTAVAAVDEAVRLGADAVAIGCTVCGDRQQELLSQLGEFVRQSSLAGYPTVTHIYPKGNLIGKDEWYREDHVKYAARAGPNWAWMSSRRSTRATRKATPGLCGRPRPSWWSPAGQNSLRSKRLPDDLRRDEGRRDWRDVWRETYGRPTIRRR